MLCLTCSAIPTVSAYFGNLVLKIMISGYYAAIFSGLYYCKSVLFSANCAVTGESHFHTFDDVFYTYDGACVYKLVESIDPDNYFLITTSNIPCGATAQVCSKHVKIFVNGTTIELMRDYYLKIGSDLITNNAYIADGIIVITMDKWLVVHIPAYDLTICFDGGRYNLEKKRIYHQSPMQTKKSQPKINR